MNGRGRTIIILSFFLFFIFVFQLSRIGLLNNEELLQNYEPEKLEIIENEAFIPVKSQKIAIVYEDNNGINSHVFNNITGLIKKYKIPYDVIEYNNSNNFKINDNYDLVIAIINNIEDYSGFANLIDYAESGGDLFFAIPPHDSDSFASISAGLGVVEKFPTNSCNKIIDNIGMFGKVGFVYDFEEPINVGYKLRLRSDCEVYLSDETSNPLLWKRKMGEGSIYCSNSSFISSYDSRGVLSQIIFETINNQQSLLFPAYLVSTQLLEEFPSPLLDANYPMMKKMGKDYDEFIKNDFWHMLSQQRKKYDIKSTISYLLSYDVKTSGEFKESYLLTGNLKSYGTDVLINGGEIATHGYNLRPLSLSGGLEEIGWYIPWERYDSMKSSFELTKDIINSIFSKYKVRAYVPPQGRISQGALEKLKSLNNDFNVIVSPYKKSYKDQILRDFETDEYGFFHYNTTSSIDSGLWSTKNSLYSMGISSIRLNINETMRENEDITFNEYETILNSMVDEIYSLIPDIKNMTISEASAFIKYYENLDVAYSETNINIDVKTKNYFDGVSFILKTNDEILPGDDYTFYKADDFYIIKPLKPNVLINKRVI